MKTRILVSAVALPLLVVVVCFAPLWSFGAVVGAVAAVAAWELLRCVETGIRRRVLIYTAVSAFAIPFWRSFGLEADGTPVVVFLLFAAVFCELMWSFKNEQTMDFETVTTVLLAGAVMPLLLSSLVRLGLPEDTGRVTALLPFVVAFSSDSGAYFTGRFLGRHKLAPRLSPHKTLEGAAGGFVSAVALTLLYGVILRSAGLNVDYPVLACYGFLGSLACQMGDLSFSAVKRLCGVKDYGKLIPGHGGMLDRFDSMFFTAPLIEPLVLWVPAIWK
jgi:phosphatidate cytidylyltransferase